MVELVQRDAGWNTVSLGDKVLSLNWKAAFGNYRPKLIWLSFSYITDCKLFLSGYAALHDEFSAEVAFVVGGCALTEELRHKLRFSAFCDTMRQLEGFAQMLRIAIDKHLT
jgi:hypothetical protein